MFWSLILEPGRKYSSLVDDAFHVSMAAVSLKTVKSDKDIFPVLCKVDNGEEMVLCNLSKTTFPQHSLDLNFEKGSKVEFYTTGSAAIHLTGYLLNDLTDDYDESDLDSSDESAESSDEASAPPKKGQGDEKSSQKKKRKSDVQLDAVAKKKSKSKSGEEEGSKNGLDMRMKTLNDSKGSDESDTDDVDEDMDDFDLSSSDLGSDSPSDGSDDDDGDVDEEEEEDDDDDDDSDDDSEASSEKVIPQKTPQQTPKKKVDEKTPKQGKTPQIQTPKQGKTPQNQTPKQGKTPQNQTPKQGKTPQNQTPVSNKKQNQQLANGATPKSDKKAKNKDTPQPKQAGKDTPQKQSGSPKKQTLAGGVQVEELKPGKGPVAKAGKMVSVYYTGRLKNTNRVFDQSQTGPGFKFRLGQGEVIKGWDVGVAGMSVGSKRRITCPANMAYGSKGSGPQIPPNATLVFDVELKSVN